MKQYDPEWTANVLADLHDFFAENGMKQSASAVKAALTVVKREINADRGKRDASEQKQIN